MTPTTPQRDFAAPYRAVSPEHQNGASEEWDNIFNIVLLGLTGTGKSASANTILAAGNSRLCSGQLFKSESSSLPVTTQCDVRIVMKLFGTPVRVVDTPDFLNDQLKNSEEPLEECKKYCQPGRCVVLLVLQLGRFTEGERGILQKLEDKLGWPIRESTIVLLTHGEDLEGYLEHYIGTHNDLKSIVDDCSNRCHLFRNISENSKQVMELVKKIPNFKKIFPKIGKNLGSDCCVS